MSAATAGANMDQCLIGVVGLSVHCDCSPVANVGEGCHGNTVRAAADVHDLSSEDISC